MNEVTCPMCGGSEFTSFNTRPQAMCKECKSYERTRLVWLILQELVDVGRPMDVLHFAPEPGIARRLHEVCGERYRAFDYDPSRYPLGFTQVAKKDLCDPELGIAPGSVDLVLHNHVMEHVPCNPWQVMKRLDALLRPGGLHVFSLPVTGEHYDEDLNPNLTGAERTARFGQDDHMRVFGRQDLRDSLIREFGEDLHFARHTRLEAAALTGAGVPAYTLEQICSHTVYVHRRPEAAAPKKAQSWWRRFG